MKTHLLRFIVLLTLLLSLMPDAIRAQEPQTATLMRVAYASQEDLGYLAAWLDVWEVDPQAQTALVYVTPEQVERLRQEHYALTPVAPASVGLQTVPGYPCYHTVTEMYGLLEQWAAAYPHLTQRIEIGHSFEGRPLYVLRITNKATGLNKPVLFVMSNVHGREMITPEVTLAFIETLLTGYGVNADITWLLDHQRVEVVVTVNPDGHIKNESGYPWSWWRKNTNPQGCSYSNYYGVDLNRNYPFRWSAAGTGGPCDSTYPGTGPLSEPESQAISTYLSTLFPVYAKPGEGQAAPLTTAGLFIDVHSYGNLVLWPWGDVATAPPNSAQLTALGSKLAAITGYRASQSYQGLYPTSGTADDWVYAEFGVPGYTIEVGDGNDGFYPSCSRYQALVPPNVAMLLYAAKVARQPYQLAYGPDVTALQVLNAAPLSADEPLRLQAVVDDAQTGGRPLSAAEAYIDTPPWAGGTAYPLAAADGSFNSARETVSGQLPTTNLSSGRHIVLVRGRDNSGAWGPLTAAFFTVAADGTLKGQVQALATGLPLAGVEVSLSNGTVTHRVTTDAQGRFTFTLRAGTYTLRAAAWGYYTAETTVMVLSSQVVTQNLSLAAMPRGWVQVSVQEVGTARPLTATVHVEGTSVSGLVTPHLALALPLGRYTLRAEAPGYPTRAATIEVTAGFTTPVRFHLPPAPPLLLVGDGGAPDVAAALASMGYPFAVWNLTTQGVPEAAALIPYTAVAWMSEEGTLTPAAQAALSAYLEAGGHLLLSGSHLGATLDGTDFYREVLRARWEGPVAAPWSVGGEAELAGLTAFGDDEGTAEALAPASAEARVLARYGDGRAAVLEAARLIYLGFGLETQPVATQQAWLAALLPRLEAWPPARLEARLDPAVSAFVPGQALTYRLTLYNDSLWQIPRLALTLTVPSGVMLGRVTGGKLQGEQVAWSALSIAADTEQTLTWTAFIPADWTDITWEVTASWAELPDVAHFTFRTPVRLMLPRVWLPLLQRAP